VRFNLEIAIRADFADIFEVKGNHIVRRGRITTSWSYKRQALRFAYRNTDFCREVIVRLRELAVDLADFRPRRRPDPSFAHAGAPKRGQG
jgi:hypothetical protein